MDQYGQPPVFNQPANRNLPNATAVLVLGIISIVGSCCYGIVGIICGIIALVMYGKDANLYRADPNQYSLSSYNNLKAGRICAIIGLVISALYIIGIIIAILMFGTGYLSNPAFMLDR